MRLIPASSALVAGLVLVLAGSLLPVATVVAATVVTTDDAASTNEDHQVVIDVLGNDTGSPLSVLSATDPAHGSTQVTGGGTTVTYTPDANTNGTDTFDYTASDGAGGSDTATVTVTVTAVNDAPIAGDDPSSGCNNPAGAFGGSFPIPEDYGVLTMVNGLGMCSLDFNDGDVDGDELTYQLVSGPSHASTFVFDPAGHYQYKPVGDYSTNPGDWVSDSFTYRVSDGAAWSSPATMRF